MHRDPSGHTDIEDQPYDFRIARCRQPNEYKLTERCAVAGCEVMMGSCRNDEISHELRSAAATMRRH
jgi:hypothetical protein